MNFDFLMLITFVVCSIDRFETRIVEHEEISSDVTSTVPQWNTTTSWWTRTFPILDNKTVSARSRFHLRTTTIPIRISRVVRLTVPVAIFGATLLFGFGLIIFAVLTRGHGVSFLTRTNEHRLV